MRVPPEPDPGRVKRELTLDFGTERDTQLRRTSTFLDLRDQVQRLLLEELVEG